MPFLKDLSYDKEKRGEMIETLATSVHKVFNDTIGEPVTEWKHHIRNGYISRITLKRESDIPLFVVFKQQSLKEIAEVLFMDDAPDEATLQDLSCEMANLIAGCAKTVASEKQSESFDISTPEFVGNQNINAKGSVRSSFRYREITFTLVLGNTHA